MPVRSRHGKLPPPEARPFPLEDPPIRDADIWASPFAVEGDALGPNDLREGELGVLVPELARGQRPERRNQTWGGNEHGQEQEGERERAVFKKWVHGVWSLFGEGTLCWAEEGVVL